MEKWLFLDQNLWKNVIFSTFWSWRFYSLEWRFFVLEYHKKHFFGPMLPVKKSWKNGHFWTKTMGLPFGNMSIFWRFEFVFFLSLERLFFVLECHKRHFPNLYCLKKKNVGKMVVFGLKPWVNPFKKMSISGLFKLFVFMA